MSDKIRENEKTESIPGENDLPDVKSKEHYENLVTQRRVNSLEVGEVSTEDLEGVAGGKGHIRRPRWWKPNPHPLDIHLKKYAGPPPKPIIPKPLTPEEQKKLEEEKKKEREKKIEQILKLAREIDEDRSNR